jgi:hypothetical protein
MCVVAPPEFVQVIVMVKSRKILFARYSFELRFWRQIADGPDGYASYGLVFIDPTIFHNLAPAIDVGDLILPIQRLEKKIEAGDLL